MFEGDKYYGKIQCRGEGVCELAFRGRSNYNFNEAQLCRYLEGNDFARPEAGDHIY